MSDEHQSIRALHMYANKLRDKNAPSVTARDWMGDLISVPWSGGGSDNRPPLSWACELYWFKPGSEGYTKAVNWWSDWCEFQDDPKVGFEGRELGSRIYDSWMTCAAVMALNNPGIPETLSVLLNRHLARLWVLQALGAVPQSQGQSYYSGPTVTWCGMRSVAKDGSAMVRAERNELDTMFAMATGMQYRLNAFENTTGPAICYKLWMGLSEEQKVPIRSLVNRQTDAMDLIGLFDKELKDIVTRVPILISRWSNGSTGTMIEQDIGVSTPPVYGMIMHGTQAKQGSYLVTHLPGDNPKHYVHGTCRETGFEWKAQAERAVSMDIPIAVRDTLVRIDKNGFGMSGHPSQPPSEPPSQPPVDPPIPPDQPPTENPPEYDEIMYHLDSAMKQRTWGSNDMCLKHTQRAEKLLIEELQ